MISISTTLYKTFCVLIATGVILFLMASQPCVAAPAKLRQIAIVDLPGAPGFDTAAWAGDQLLLAHRGAATVDVFDPARRRVIAHIDGVSAARGIAIDETGKRIFIADLGQSAIAVVTPGAWKVQTMIPVDAAPASLLYLPKTQMLYYTAASQPLLGIVDVAAHRQIASIALAGRPAQLGLDAIRNLLYVTVEDANQIAVVNASDGTVIRKFPLNASQPTGVVVDSVNRRIYVAVRYAVLALDEDTGTEVSRVPTPGGTDTLLYAPQDHTLYAVATDGTVDGITVSAGELRLDSELKTDVHGHSIALDASRKLLYVPGGKEGQSRLVILKQFGLNAAANDGTRTAQAR